MRRIAILALAIALMMPGVAMAQSSSSCEGYNSQLCESVTTTNESGTLPFTGLDVSLLLVGGAALLGSGLVVRKLSRRVN